MRSHLKKAIFLFAALLVGFIESPLFCEKHQTDDLCWIDSLQPKGGGAWVDE